MESVEIFAYYEAAADEKLAKLAKRAKRYGQLIEWRKEPYVHVRERKRWDGKVDKIEVPMIRYHVEGEAPRIGEFKFLAQLELVPGAGVLIAGGEVGDLGRQWDGRCEHCGKNRSRRLGYVVENADGSRLIVGKSCLRDYVGRDVPAGALWIFQFERSLADMSDEEGWGYGGRWQDEVLGIVAAARAAIALYGWAPRSSEGRSSADDVGLIIWPPVRLSDEQRVIRREMEAELKARGDHYHAVAREVIEWGRALDPKNDYENNLKVSLAAEFADYKRFGLVVSAAAAFDRQKAREEEVKQRAVERAAAVSKWFGKVGERAEAELELVAKRAMPDRGYGPSVLHVFKGPEGELIKWFSVNSLCVGGKPAESGARFKAKFSVKRHGEFQGIKESVVLRVAEVVQKGQRPALEAENDNSRSH